MNFLLKDVDCLNGQQVWLGEEEKTQHSVDKAVVQEILLQAHQTGLQQWQSVGLGQTEALKHKQLNVLCTNNTENALCASSCTHFQGLVVWSHAGMHPCYCTAEFGLFCSRSKERNAGFTVLGTSATLW